MSAGDEANVNEVGMPGEETDVGNGRGGSTWRTVNISSSYLVSAVIKMSTQGNVRIIAIVTYIVVHSV